MPMRLVTTADFGRLHIFDSRERSTTRFRPALLLRQWIPCLVLRIALRQDRTTDSESVALARKPILPTRYVPQTVERFTDAARINLRLCELFVVSFLEPIALPIATATPSASYVASYCFDLSS